MQGFVTNALETWASLYANHGLIRTMIGFMHIGGLIAGGGCAIAADRITLMNMKREATTRAAQLDVLRNTHRFVILSLIIVTMSGFLLFAADSETYIYSKLFWTKMGLFALLLANGVLLVSAERKAARGDARGWNRLMASSIASIALWSITTLAGVGLLNIG